MAINVCLQNQHKAQTANAASLADAPMTSEWYLVWEGYRPHNTQILEVASLNIQTQNLSQASTHFCHYSYALIIVIL